MTPYILIAYGCVAVWFVAWLLFLRWVARRNFRLHTPESVAREIVEGLEDGSVTLHEDDRAG
jgi:hypothetical protein